MSTDPPTSGVTRPPDPLSVGHAAPQEAKASIVFLLIMAGLGGMLPTMSRMAAFYVVNPAASLPEPGFYVGLVCFFAIGAVIGFALAEHNVRRAVLVGIAAPGIITNVASGVSETNNIRGVHAPPAPALLEQGATAPAAAPPARAFGASGPQQSLAGDGGSGPTRLAGNEPGPPASPRLIHYLQLAGNLDTDRMMAQNEYEPIVIEAQMPPNIEGTLESEVVFVYEALNEEEWDPKPAADVAVGNAVRYRPKPHVSVLGFTAGEAVAATPLTPHFSGRICLGIETVSSNDFLWALGFRRVSRIVAIKPSLTEASECSFNGNVAGVAAEVAAGEAACTTPANCTSAVAAFNPLGVPELA